MHNSLSSHHKSRHHHSSHHVSSLSLSRHRPTTPVTTNIVDFLNASSIRYSLTVNPTVYVSYIKQFWSTAKTKTANNETQIYAKVAGKSVVVTESSVRSDLHFNDEDGATCLTTVEIFENLALMGYERDSDKLSFEKALFSPHWKYRYTTIHTLLEFKINCLE
ncbi:hypothetical protein Tco_1492405 [Tanacetum coccineum]